MAAEIISKRCSKCKQFKTLSEFTKWHNGKLGCHNQCKICKSAWAKTYKAKLYHKKYQQSQRGRQINQANSKRYGRSKKGRATQNRRREKDIDKCAARSAVSNAIKLKQLPKASGLNCHYCHNIANQWHHHLGYAPEHWLDVVPICVKCHSKVR